MAYISLQHVGKRYQMGEITITAVDDISFEIEKGQFAVIVGALRCGQDHGAEHPGGDGRL